MLVITMILQVIVCDIIPTKPDVRNHLQISNISVTESWHDIYDQNLNHRYGGNFICYFSCLIWNNIKYHHIHKTIVVSHGNTKGRFSILILINLVNPAGLRGDQHDPTLR